MRRFVPTSDGPDTFTVRDMRWSFHYQFTLLASGFWNAAHPQKSQYVSTLGQRQARRADHGSGQPNKAPSEVQLQRRAGAGWKTIATTRRSRRALLPAEQVGPRARVHPGRPMARASRESCSRHRHYAANRGQPLHDLLPGRHGLMVRLLAQAGPRPALLDGLHRYADELVDAEPLTEAFVMCLDPQEIRTPCGCSNGSTVRTVRTSTDQVAPFAASDRRTAGSSGRRTAGSAPGAAADAPERRREPLMYPWTSARVAE